MAFMPKLTRALPGVKLVPVDNSEHFIMLDQPEPLRRRRWRGSCVSIAMR